MFPLHPETPPEGVTLEELFKTDSARIHQMITQLRETADALGLVFGERHMTFNSRLAQELGVWAEEKGVGDSFHTAVFEAYFGDGKNLADHTVLLDLVEKSGLPRMEANKVLENRSYREQVDRDWQRSRTLGIQAAPTFVLNQSRLVGAQNYRTLQGLMMEHNVARILNNPV